MKFFSLYFLFSFTLIFSQKNQSDLHIKYRTEFAVDTTHVEKSISEEMTLTLNRNSSIYYSDKYIQALEAIKKKMELAVNSNSAIEIKGGDFPLPQLKFSVFRRDNEIFVSSQIRKDTYTFKADFLKWNTNFSETKEILGYQCNKATLLFNKRQYTAWYTNDLPFPEGPYRFKGLPGLILYISDEQGYHKFEAVEIKKTQTEIEQLHKGVLVTREEYIKKREEYKDNPRPDKVMPPQQRNQMIANQKKSNNPLE